MGIFGAFWIGLAAGLMRLSKRWWVKYPAVLYIEIIRGVPLLMLIFWFYFLAPILLGRTLPEFQSALVAFIVFTGAYIAEIVRAGVIALPRGQMEAARGTGLSNAQAMTHVILPQALRNMIPSFVNQFVSLTKDTSLAYIIGVNELTRAATQVNNRTPDLAHGNLSDHRHHVLHHLLRAHGRQPQTGGPALPLPGPGPVERRGSIRGGSCIKTFTPVPFYYRPEF